MASRMREAANRGLRLAAVIGNLFLTTFACPAQSISEREIASEKSRAARPSDQRLAAAHQQLALADERIARLSAEEAARLTSFVVGNLYFVLVHELGHAVINQLNLPVLGREEDAADSFATLSMLLIGTKLSETVLRETVHGFWLTAQRDKSDDRDAGNLRRAQPRHATRLPDHLSEWSVAGPQDLSRLCDNSENASRTLRRPAVTICARAAHSWEALLFLPFACRVEAAFLSQTVIGAHGLG